MVVADGIHGAHAGQNALPAAAEARHHMVRARAQTDHPVRVRREGMDPHPRAVGRDADVHQIRREAVVVHHADAIVNTVRHQRTQLGLVAADVRSVRHQNRDLRVRNARAVHIIHQRRNHPVLSHPEARHVADNQADPVTRTEPVLQRRRVHGRIQRLVQRRGNVLNRRNAVSM